MAAGRGGNCPGLVPGVQGRAPVAVAPGRDESGMAGRCTGRPTWPVGPGRGPGFGVGGAIVRGVSRGASGVIVAVGGVIVAPSPTTGTGER